MAYFKRKRFCCKIIKAGFTTRIPGQNGSGERQENKRGRREKGSRIKRKRCLDSLR